MEQSTHSDPVPVELRTQIARLCVLGRYLIEALDLQQVEPSMRQHVTADKFVLHTMEVLREQTGRLDSLARAMPGPQGDFLEPSVSLAGLFMKFISKKRARALPDMLHNDQVMLRLATANYTLLHNLGVKLGESSVADLARLHLDQLSSLMREIRHLLPAHATGEDQDAPRGEAAFLTGPLPEPGPAAC